MSRKPRIFSPTGIYHIILRSINQHIIFEEDADYLKMLHTLAECKRTLDIDIYAYCLMDNHVHLLMHASVTMHAGKGYLFLGKSGTGKSTHSQLWINNIEGCELLNDDNPVLRVEDDGSVRVYGSPWSGKTPCYRNLDVPVGAIVDLH
ncbi:MAG: transposase, partial [Lachnospiraceae bacterium]|nr:transposase [Lachnospiraceae bacterium]